MEITFPLAIFNLDSYLGIVNFKSDTNADLAFSFFLKIINPCSIPDLYFARPCGCEHLKTIYWRNLLLLSGIAGHYFQNFIIRVFLK